MMKNGNGKRERLMDFDVATFNECFGRRPFLFRHNMARYPLFDIPRLVEMSKRLPDYANEYNAGNVPVNLDPKDTPRTSLTIEETVARIHETGSWIGFRYIHTEPEHRELLDRCLDEIAPLSEPLSPGMWGRAAYLFVSSPRSVTPYHMDAEYNFLIQIRGHKRVHLFDPTDREIIKEEELETLFKQGHRNRTYHEAIQKKACTFDLIEGNGLHFPYNWPHWVENLDDVSVSYSVTFQNKASDRKRLLYNINHDLRAYGLSPTPYDEKPWLDSLKVGAFVTARIAKRMVRGPRIFRLPEYLWSGLV